MNLKKNINRWDEDTINNIDAAFREAASTIESQYSVNITLGKLKSGKRANDGYYDSGTRLDIKMDGVNISLDPECMGLEFSDKEKKDWKLYQKRSINKMMQHIQLGVPLVFDGDDLKYLLTSRSADIFRNVSHAYTGGASSTLRIDKRFSGGDAYTDIILEVIPCGRHRKMFKDFIPIKVISTLWNKDHTKIISRQFLTASVPSHVFNYIFSPNKLKKLMITTILQKG